MIDVDVTEIRRLRDQGLSVAKIAARLGVGDHVVWRRLNPSRAREQDRRADAKPGRSEAKRAWEREHDRPECECGNLMSVGAHRAGNRRCIQCERTRRKLLSLERMATIERLWNSGHTQAQIAAELDCTVKSVNTAMVNARKAGFDLPYRHPAFT